MAVRANHKVDYQAAYFSRTDKIQQQQQNNNEHKTNDSGKRESRVEGDGMAASNLGLQLGLVGPISGNACG